MFDLGVCLIIDIQGRIQGGGGQDPPFWGTPKLHKEGEKRRGCTRTNATF